MLCCHAAQCSKRIVYVKQFVACQRPLGLTMKLRLNSRRSYSIRASVARPGTTTP